MIAILVIHYIIFFINIGITQFGGDGMCTMGNQKDILGLWIERY